MRGSVGEGIIRQPSKELPMCRFRMLLLLALFSLTLLMAPSLEAAPQSPEQAEVRAPGKAAEQTVEPKKFMRFVDDGHSGGKFETAVVTYRNKDGATVRLIGAIHIGEKSYYDALNK